MLKAKELAELEAESDREPLPGEVILREGAAAVERVVAEVGDRRPGRLLVCSRADEDLMGAGTDGACTQPASVAEGTTDTDCEDKANKVLAACEVT